MTDEKKDKEEKIKKIEEEPEDLEDEIKEIEDEKKEELEAGFRRPSQFWGGQRPSMILESGQTQEASLDNNFEQNVADTSVTPIAETERAGREEGEEVRYVTSEEYLKRQYQIEEEEGMVIRRSDLTNAEEIMGQTATINPARQRFISATSEMREIGRRKNQDYISRAEQLERNSKLPFQKNREEGTEIKRRYQER